MNYKTLFLTPLMSLILVSSLTFSQNQITLDSLISSALVNNEKIKIAQLNRDVSTENIKLAKNAFFPALNFTHSDNFSFGRFIDPTDNVFRNVSNYYNNWSINVNWTLFNGNQNRVSLTKEQVNSRLVSIKTELSINQIKQEIATSYFGLANLKSNLKVLEEKKSSLIKIRSIYHKKFTTGRVSGTDTLEVYNQILYTELQLSQIKAQTIEFLVYIRYLTGIDELTIDQIQISNDVVIEKVNDSSTSSSNHLANELADTEVLLKEKEKKLTSTLYFPKLSLNSNIFTGYSAASKLNDPITGTPIDYPFMEQVQNNFNQMVSLNLVMPIYDNRKLKTESIIREIELKKSKLNRQRIQNDMDQLYKKDLAKLDANIESLEGYKLFIKNEKKIFENNSDLFKSGNLAPTQFLFVQDRYFQAKSNLIMLQYRYLLNHYLLLLKFSNQSSGKLVD